MIISRTVISTTTHFIHTYTYVNTIRSMQCIQYSYTYRYTVRGACTCMHHAVHCTYVPCLPGLPCTTSSDGAPFPSSCFGDCNSSVVSSSCWLHSDVPSASEGRLSCSLTSTWRGNGRLLGAVGWERTMVRYRQGSVAAH